MEVLNGGDFDQKNVLIGQSGKTQAFGVTNDPVLMGILSTGLYGNPMRTMIQEVMFNAWDAHRMGNCQDKPIDIYINDTSGLIVRDYGPGIDPKEMVPIYCIYGNSTKRKDDSLTGGFGLGSKSPYAYTDSFTVTSHHQNTKNMYIMNRVSEENNGGPGMSPIIEGVPTSESGLLVTIPLKNERDMTRAYEFIKELLFLSGIKANLHFENDVETIEAEEVPPGQWTVDDKENGEIFAVYGGVRYKIPDDDSYSPEYSFVSKISRLLGTLYIGFKPSSLTPLPSREGLNLNERTVEAIKNQLEIMEEHFRAMLNPATRVVLNESFKSLCESGVEPKFLIQVWKRIGGIRNLREATDEKHPVLFAAYDQCPQGQNQSMWRSLCDLIYKKTDDVERMVGVEKFAQMKYIIWAKTFPEYKHYKDYILAKLTPNNSYQSVEMLEAPKSMAELIEAKKLCDSVTDQDNDLRIEKGSDDWKVLSNMRRAGKIADVNRRQKNIIDALGGNLKKPELPYKDRLWFKKDGQEFSEVLLTKQIIVAKTLSALKDTKFSYQSMFTSNYPHVHNHHNFHRSNFGDHYYRSCDRPVAAIIVHQRKGNYDKAVQALEDAGWTVHEADEPVAVTRPVAADGTVLAPTPRGKPTYPLYGPQFSDWADWDNEVENPTCYVCVTEHKVRYGYSSDLPDKRLLAFVSQKTPRLVILHNKARSSPLERKKIPEFSEKLHQLVVKILEDPERVQKMVMHSIFKEESNLPPEMLALPELQKFFKVPYLRTKQKETFERDFLVLDTINDLRRNPWVKEDTCLLVNNMFKEIEKSDSVSVVRSMCNKCSLFSSYDLKAHVRKMKPGEVKVFSEKFMRFLRTV